MKQYEGPLAHPTDMLSYRIQSTGLITRVKRGFKTRCGNVFMVAKTLNLNSPPWKVMGPIKKTESTLEGGGQDESCLVT